MGLFSAFFNSKKNNFSKKIDIIAPLSGEIINLENVPDMVFSKKIVGDGIAIQPSGSQILSPVNGVIGKIFDSMHAFSIVSEDNVELLVHFGIDTVKLHGKGFSKIAKDNQSVKIGDVIINFNIDFLKKNAKSIVTPVIISNTDNFKKIEKSSGTVTAGKTIIFSLYK
ncbi:PTS glucose transporter subunit IIA [Buchnera aphidicola]|uniref:PTS glucose transporter subunit IIA n=1 Tax=Buchnera aphidicola TaxID=9 RepID=UPI003463F179